MAEQHKESSPENSKEKSSSIDDDIGKGFLSSWKSMSMADDVAMDFSFETVSKSKKKTFDFEKLDMNFNLDGEFDKISSFKLDMSDLDFSCPPKKASQSKEKKGESSGAIAGKQDGFNFNFDFNELNSFNLDSSLTKVDTTSNSNLNKKGVTTEGSDSEGAEKPKSNDDEGVYASNDSMVVKPHTSKRLETSKVETLVGNVGELVPRQDGSVSILSPSKKLDMANENQTSDMSKRESAEEINQERDLLQKTKLTESKSQQLINTAPSQSVVQSDSERDTISEQHTKVIPSGTGEMNVSGDKQEVNDKAAYADSEGTDLQLENSSPRHITMSDSSVGDAINLGSNTQAGVTNRPEKSHTSPENINKTDALKRNSCDYEIKDEKTTLEGHLATPSSKAIIDRMMLMKDKELQVLQSNMFSMPGYKRPLKHPSSTAGTKGIASFGSRKDADMRLGSITQAQESFGSKDSKFRSKLVSEFLPDSGKLKNDAPALLVCKDDPKSCANTRKGIVLDVMHSSSKLAGNMQSFHAEVNKSKDTNIETGLSTEDVNMLSSQVKSSCLMEKTGRITSQISSNSQPEDSGKESSLKSRTTLTEGNKLSSFKGCKITPAFSSLKILRNIGANRVLTTSHQKQTNSSVCLGQSMEIQGIAAPKNDRLTEGGDNQKPSTTFLKRKNAEVSEADLTSLRSLKRLSQPPNKCRNSIESPEVVKEVPTLESKASNLLHNHSKSRLKSPSEIQEMEVEMPDSVLMEDNSNVEKAEAYMKELEDICNILKKKHEEAKELLVRAIVNNNNLLMLNHSIYEEEIQKLQKFASS